MNKRRSLVSGCRMRFVGNNVGIKIGRIVQITLSATQAGRQRRRRIKRRARGGGRRKWTGLTGRHRGWIYDDAVCGGNGVVGRQR